MAKIVLTIEAENAGDLREALSDLASAGEDGGERGTFHTHGTFGGSSGAPNSAPETQPSPQPEPPRRTRRTKAELEMDAGSKAIDPSSVGSAAEPDTSPESHPVLAKSAAEPESSSSATKQDVLNVVGQISAKGVPPLTIQEALIKNFNVERVGKLEEHQWAAAIKVLLAL